jgi:ABC-type glutathione transport system ATPase component
MGGTPESIQRAWSAILVLLIVVFIMFVLARSLGQSRQRNKLRIMNESVQLTENGTHMSNQPNHTDSFVAIGCRCEARKTKSAGTQPLGTGLEARGVHAWFDKHHALEDVSLDFSAGTVTALIGPSGCGKSTFIRTLNRMHEFIPHTSMAGQVLLDGKDIYEPGYRCHKDSSANRYGLSEAKPIPSMTIGENVLSGLKLAQLKVDNHGSSRRVPYSRRLMDRSKGPTWRTCRRPLRRPATASLYRTCTCSEAKGFVDG